MPRILRYFCCVQLVAICLWLTACGGSSSQKNTLTQPNFGSGTIPATFFGMNQVHLTGPANSGCDTGSPHIAFTSAPIGAFRDWDTCATQWPNLEPSPGQYNFTGLDTVLADAQAAGVNDVMMEIGRVPNWANNKLDYLCDASNTEQPGFCDPPTDLDKTPGSGLGDGTDATFRAFATALLQHISDPTYLQTHAPVTYIEIFEEFHRSDTVGGVPTLTGTVSISGPDITSVSGSQFTGALPGDVMVIGGASYAVSSVSPDGTSLVLSSSPTIQNTTTSFAMSGCHNPANGIACSWRGTFAQMLRMLQDLRCLAKGNSSDPITALNSTCGSAGYGTTGIYPSLQVSVGNAGPDPNFDNGAKVMANFLYCNQSPSPASQCNYGSAGSAATDMIGGHAYFNTGLPEDVLRWIVSQVGLFSAPDKAKPYFIGEGGWGSNTHVTDPGLQAAFVPRWYLSLWMTGLVQRGYWWSWEQAGASGIGGLWSPEALTSGSQCLVLDPNGGYYCTGGIAYKEMVDWLAGAAITGFTCPGGCSNLRNGVFQLTLTRPNGYQASVIWDSSPVQSCGNAQCGSSLPPSATFAISQWRDVAGNTHTGAPSAVGAAPIIVENMAPPSS